MPLIVAFLLVMLLVIRQYMLSLEFCDVDLGVQVLDFLWIFWDVQDSISAAEMILGRCLVVSFAFPAPVAGAQKHFL